MIHNAELRAYVARIRNVPKKVYACAYIEWKEGGGHGEEPARPATLSYMGAQAVRLHTYNVLNQKVGNV